MSEEFQVMRMLLILACVPALFAQFAEAPRQGGLASPPVLVHKVEAEYPADARQKRFRGVVLLSADIGVDGVPAHIRVVQSLDPVLDKRAMEALQQWRFRPAQIDGKPVRSDAKIEFRFEQPKFPLLPDSSTRAEEEPVQDNDPLYPFWW